MSKMSLLNIGGVSSKWLNQLLPSDTSDRNWSPKCRSLKPWKGHKKTLPKRSPAELPGICCKVLLWKFQLHNEAYGAEGYRLNPEPQMPWMRLNCFLVYLYLPAKMLGLSHICLGGKTQGVEEWHFKFCFFPVQTQQASNWQNRKHFLETLSSQGRWWWWFKPWTFQSGCRP